MTPQIATPMNNGASETRQVGSCCADRLDRLRYDRLRGYTNTQCQMGGEGGQYNATTRRNTEFMWVTAALRVPLPLTLGNEKNITAAALLSAFKLGLHERPQTSALRMPSAAGCKTPTLLPAMQTTCAARRRTAPKLQ